MVEDVVRSAAAVFIFSALALTAYVLAWRIAGHGRTFLRWVAACVALAWLPTLLFHALSFAGLFSVGPAAIAAAALAAIACRSAGDRGLRGLLAIDRAFLRRVGRACRRSPHRGWVLAFLACASPGLLRALFLPPLGWDTLTYHGVKAAMWIQNSGPDSMVGTGPWGYYRNMLAGGEVFTAWAMLPMHADTLTGAVEVGQWIALGLAVMVLARTLGVGEPFASTAAGFVLALPTVHLLPGSGYVELGLLLSLTAGLSLGIAGSARKPGLLALAGAGLGVSAATKLTMVPLCGGLVLFLAAHASLRGTRRARAWTLAGIAAFAVSLGPWLLLTYQRTGSLFSPFPIRIGSWALGEAPPEVAWMLQRPIPSAHRLLVEAAVLAQIFHGFLSRSESLGLLTLVPLAAAPIGLRSLVRRRPLGAILAGFVIVATVLTFYSSGFAAVRYFWAPSCSRFLLPMAAVAVVASVAWCHAGSSRSRLYGTLLRAIALLHLLLYLVYGFSPASLLGTVVILVGLALLVGIAVYVSLARRAWLWAAATFLLAVAAVVGLQSLRGVLRDRLLMTDFAIHAVPKYWAGAVPMVDRQGGARRIAVTSGPKQALDNWFAYPFMGRRLQNDLLYVPISGDGAIRPFGGAAAGEELASTADFDAWHRRLRGRGVSEVVSFEPPSIELSWMERRPDLFEPLAGEAGRWGLFRLRAPGG